MYVGVKTIESKCDRAFVPHRVVVRILLWGTYYIVTVAFLRRVQIFLLTYLLTYLLTKDKICGTEVPPPESRGGAPIESQGFAFRSQRQRSKLRLTKQLKMYNNEIFTNFDKRKTQRLRICKAPFTRYNLLSNGLSKPVVNPV